MLFICLQLLAICSWNRLNFQMQWIWYILNYFSFSQCCQLIYAFASNFLIVNGEPNDAHLWLKINYNIFSTGTVVPISHLTTFLYIIQICNLRVLLLSTDHLADIVTAMNTTDEYCMFFSKIFSFKFRFRKLYSLLHFQVKFFVKYNHFLCKCWYYLNASHVNSVVIDELLFLFFERKVCLNGILFSEN